MFELLFMTIVIVVGATCMVAILDKDNKEAAKLLRTVIKAGCGCAAFVVVTLLSLIVGLVFLIDWILKLSS